VILLSLGKIFNPDKFHNEMDSLTAVKLVMKLSVVACIKLLICDSVISIEFNVTISDADNLVLYWNFSWNGTGNGVWVNVTNSTDLTDPSQSNNSLSGTVGDEIGYMFCSSDDQGNVGCDSERTFEILAAPAADTCSPTSPLTAAHTYLGSDDCIITTDVDANENDIICQGTGTLTIKAILLNVRNFFTHECNVFCYNTPTCFG